MICKLKTLKGETFDVECSPDMIVSAFLPACSR